MVCLNIGSNISFGGITAGMAMELEYEYTGDKNADYDKTYDNQIQKAIEILNNK